MHLVIAGGGIGGLTLALAAKHFGMRATVLEQAPAFVEVGAGVQLSPNAMRVMRALGLEAALVARAFAPLALEMRDGETGRAVFEIPLGGVAAARWGAPYLNIHRADVQAVLRDAVPDASITMRARVSGFAGHRDGVVVSLSDGRSIDGDVLAGADGIHSVIREQIAGKDVPRFTGNIAWRAVMPVAALGGRAPPPTACAWVGRGRHAVTYLLRGGTLANFVGVVETATPVREDWDAEGAKAEARADFAGWDPVISGMIDAAATLNRWALFDRAPMASWHAGRAVLLGDACHPMLPFLAQGAAMAIEDAWVLARELAQAPDHVAAFTAYERQRQSRTARMQAGARANMGLFHRRSTLARVATYGPMWLAGRITPGFVHGRNDWIYGHDVTAG